ncbi:MAG: sugar nucleotide-binding protein [Alphaproteobacteria bacterium]|uniref:SDR family oxidoreductase n=1 Tax=Brevundimonas sp. TaxID=1871086 RepID=UPI001ECE86C5|nr:sugar nucleotide-binding protein [Brevundimonas sp.]MBU3974309.1 sugar nucleotide-binding protein [Alphaproteobacteria bacterium]
MTGGGGMLGAAFAELADASPHFAPRVLSRQQLDVRDVDAVMAQSEGLEGGWIVHCAAKVDVKGCADDPAAARAVIVEGTRNVIALARDSGARLLFPQSFLIYGGGDGLIHESTPPDPLSLYGALKLEAGRLVQDSLADPLVVCMAGFFGGCEADKNFVGRIIPAMHRAIRNGERVFSVGDRVWQPTWTRDLAENALHLMHLNAGGLYHMGSHGEATFHDVAVVIAEALGWSDRLRVERVSSREVAGAEIGPERRPDRAIMACERLRREGRDLQRDWRATLGAYLTHPYFDPYRFGA